MLSDFEEWEFSEEKILIGLYGYVEGAKIKGLGTISVYTEPSTMCSSKDFEEMPIKLATGESEEIIEMP